VLQQLPQHNLKSPNPQPSDDKKQKNDSAPLLLLLQLPKLAAQRVHLLLQRGQRRQLLSQGPQLYLQVVDERGRRLLLFFVFSVCVCCLGVSF
jgi:hypothetical protein